ncbi:uncharacterized protein IL334_006689 [Kwoniella shivajii]|uniref:Uncharacterized protein n=1 Tax=Kwoniella shivajii TaxID=564305 RepID=A0ABZ1D6N2_9TREE|nr:hypothetical protein IL334_006689 [Kwoniella shivajii]
MLARAAERNPSVFLPTGPKCNVNEVIPKLLSISQYTKNPWGNTKFLLTQFKPSSPPISSMSKKERQQVSEVVIKSKSIEQAAEGLGVVLEDGKTLICEVGQLLTDRIKGNTSIWEERQEAEEKGEVMDEPIEGGKASEVDGFEVGVGEAQSSDI